VVSDEEAEVPDTAAEQEGSLQGGGRIEDPQLVWRPSKVTMDWLKEMVARFVLGPHGQAMESLLSERLVEQSRYVLHTPLRLE
jgi:hypothetical protein